MRRLLVWLLPFAVLSCATLIEKMAVLRQTVRPSVNHAVHMEKDLLCADCHDPEETGTPKLPAAETCFECHENLEEENERVQSYFAAAKQKDGKYAFSRPSYMGDLIVNHEGHAKAEVDCASCHGEAGKQAFARPEPLAFMNSCMACHTERGKPNECATCHKETRKDEKPATHDAAFKLGHGGLAPENWRDGEGASCAICHDVPQNCNACHASTKPSYHGEAGFAQFHGARAGDDPFKETSCALCHKEQSCVRCHTTTKPKSHTSTFVRRLHGIVAGIDSQSCRTCHKQDSCNTCHQSTQPVSHRGNWASGQQSHCIGCHEPLPLSGCFTCHKSTVGHLGHPPKPIDAAHLGASDPTDCRGCHMVLPHLDDGGNCRRCHK